MNYNWDILGNNYNNRMGLYKFETEFKFIIKNAKNNFDSILDIAGGSGRFAIPLKVFSKYITVIDINPKALQLLKSRDSSINLVLGDYSQTEIEGYYDCIICIEAIDYFIDRDKFLLKTKSLLSKDGIFIFSYYNPGSWRFHLRNSRKSYGKTLSYKREKFKQFLNVLEKDFEILDMKGMHWTPLTTSSNSKLVSIFAIVEKIFFLDRWLSQSPWVLFSVKKR